MDQHRSQLWWLGLSCCHSYWDCTFAVGGKTPTGPDDDDEMCQGGCSGQKQQTFCSANCAGKECYGLSLTFKYGVGHHQWFTISPVRTHCLWSLPKSITHWSLLSKDIYRVVFYDWSRPEMELVPLNSEKLLSSPKIAISLLKKWNYTNATICQKFAI